MGLGTMGLVRTMILSFTFGLPLRPLPMTRNSALAGWNLRSVPAMAKPSVVPPSSVARAVTSMCSRIFPSSVIMFRIMGGFHPNLFC